MARFDPSTFAVDADRRFWREWYRDGTPNLFVGALSLVAGGVYLAGPRYDWSVGSRAVWAPAVLLLLFLVMFLLIHPRAFFATKARVSDRRTGYVRPAPPRFLRSRRSRIAFYLAVTMLSAVIRRVGPPVVDELFLAVPSLDRWWPALVALPAVVASLVGWRQYETNRFLWIGAATASGGIAGPLMHLRATDSLGLSFVVQGAALLIGGLVALRSFLKTHPIPAEG